MGLQRLAQYVGNVCTDGIIGEDSLGTQHT